MEVAEVVNASGAQTGLSGQAVMSIEIPHCRYRGTSRSLA